MLGRGEVGRVWNGEMCWDSTAIQGVHLRAVALLEAAKVAARDVCSH
jgi:hypothetical protein